MRRFLSRLPLGRPAPSVDHAAKGIGLPTLQARFRRSPYPLATADDKHMVCQRQTHPAYRVGHGRVVSRRLAPGTHPLAVGQRAQRAVPTPSLAQHGPNHHIAADADLFSSSAGRSKRPLKKHAPIWGWKRNGRGMTRPLLGAPPWCWPYSLWWCSWRIPSAGIIYLVPPA